MTTKTLTVAELIEKLKELPQDLPVYQNIVISDEDIDEYLPIEDAVEISSPGVNYPYTKEFVTFED